MVERVFREMGALGNWPQLTKTNYDSWSLLMKLKMQARHLWEAVEDDDVDFHDDRFALDAICSGVPPEMVPTITFRNRESVEDFALRISNIVQRLAILGDLEPEPKVVAKYLHVARPRYKKLVVSIEILLDIDTLSVEEWLERYKERDKDFGHDRSSSRGHGKRRGRGHGHGTGSGSDSRAGSNSGQTIADDACKACGKKGHWAKDYRSKKKVEQAHVAQDDEPSLLLKLNTVHDERVCPHSAVSPPATSPPIPPSIYDNDSQLHFTESKVFAAFAESGDRDLKRWVLDTGASNHMSRARAAFSSLDAGVTGSVRFGDSSIARIEGIGTVLLSCKNSEHRAIANVYYLPCLTANIISVGQLDEIVYQVLVEDGVMRVCDEEWRLLAKIHRNPGQLYVLNIDIAWPVYLAA
ncbi:uncharacterized protein [Miscanthus floridulus]|uniref:uncharacterized protein n=1 Tax=Miscanthus floridulus TaxID=154761 RepID=UPI003458391C